MVCIFFKKGFLNLQNYGMQIWLQKQLFALQEDVEKVVISYRPLLYRQAKYTDLLDTSDNKIYI